MNMDNLDKLLDEVTKAVNLNKELNNEKTKELRKKGMKLYGFIMNEGAFNEIEVLYEMMKLLKIKYKFGRFTIDKNGVWYKKNKNMIVGILAFDWDLVDCLSIQMWNDGMFGRYGLENMILCSNFNIEDIVVCLKEFLYDYNEFKEGLILTLIDKLNELNYKNKELLKQLNLIRTREIIITFIDKNILTHQI